MFAILVVVLKKSGSKELVALSTKSSSKLTAELEMLLTITISEKTIYKSTVLLNVVTSFVSGLIVTTLI